MALKVLMWVLLNSLIKEAQGITSDESKLTILNIDLSNVSLGGADAIVFTGGIGEKGKLIRARVCEGLEELGIAIDSDKNEQADGETSVHADSSRTQIWRIPTNEELIVARQCVALLSE